VFDFVKKVDSQEEFDSLSVDLEHKIGHEDINILHEHVLDGDIDENVFIGLRPLVLVGALLDDNF
jgi:hypothetical protein